MPLVTGCAAVRRPPATVETLETQLDSAGGVEHAVVSTVVDQLVRRVAEHDDRVLDVLVLSGGGQHGSYGIGFLRGWQSGAGEAWPEFDLVTGVSTGSIQALFAFDGRAAALDSAASLYRQAAERFAPGLDWWFWIRHTGGVVNTSKLRETIASVFDREMCERLLGEFEAGRELAISTTDLDLGQRRTWLLSEEVVDCEGGPSRIHELVLASSSIPGIFPPLVLDERVHVDGGITGNIIPLLNLDAYRTLSDRLREEGARDPVTVRLWIITNFFLEPRVVVTDPSDRGQIGQRGNLLMFSALQREALGRLDALSLAVTAGIPGLRLEVRCTAVPSELASEPGADRLFDTEWMTRLERIGYDRARGSEPWGCPTRAP